jgi:hypothetical protein
MKYLRKYNESITTLESLSNEELEEKLKWLKIEQDEIQEQMVSARKILVKRKEEEQKKHSTSLPKSIFDFNEEQCVWLFEHHHGATSEHYKIAQRYFKELTGLFQTGFNPDTKQFYFTVNVGSCFNEAEDGFQYDEKVGKSLTFLGENLTKKDGYVKFGLSYTYGEHYNDRVLYYSSDDVRYQQSWGSVSMRQGENKGSVEGLLRAAVEQDLEDKDNVDW